MENRPDMSNIENVTFFDEEALLDRLSDGLRETPNKEVVFVVGAPLTAPEKNGQPGVSNVSEMVNEIRNKFPEDKPPRIALEKELSSSPNHYQAAFRFLQGRRGQSVCNQIVRDAVLSAHDIKRTDVSGKFDVESLNEDQLNEFDADVKGWNLTRGVEALGQLIAKEPNVFGKTLLTSNFDPIAKVAILAAGGRVWHTSLTGDADLGNTHADGCHIIHFHGYWRGTDTLHTVTQLLQSRPTLKSSLLEHLKDKLVVVVAYGGWEDILTSALKELVGNNAVFPEVLWTFLDSAPAIPMHLRSVLQPGLDRGRTSLYAGINCHEFFPKLLARWRKVEKARPVEGETLATPKSFAVTSTTLKQLDCDRPPNIKTWVGRDAELRSLETTHAPVVIITGIGGQGKSLIAAKHIQDTFASSSKFRHWDWRDCKESADSIRTQVIAAIDRITSEETTSEMLTDASDADLAALLIHCGINSPTLFVFDNVDHYVDLENFRFVNLLDRLVRGFANVDTSSQIVLTCRPHVKYSETNVITILLPEFSLAETYELFIQRGVSMDTVTDDDMRAAHVMTKGHPYWLDLIAVQVAEVPGMTLEGLLEDLRRGREDTPNILSSIWERLLEREQTLLRVMAESNRPESKDTLEKYISTKLRYNKFDKALKTLVRLNLVIIKPEVNAPDLYDLHPLVRQFVKQNFSRADRIDFINLVIGQIEVLIAPLKKVLGVALPIAILGRWTQKAELEIAAHQFQEASKSLNDVKDALIGGGHSEEFIRVTRSFLEAVDWSTAPNELREFDEIVEQFIICLDELGDYEGADIILDRFSQTIPEKTARYIHLCDMKCHSFWRRGDFATAIKWGKQGVGLKKQTNVDTKHGSEHNLALAQRDFGQIEPALEHFLGQAKLERLIDPLSKEELDNGPKHGNVGRCLQLQGNEEQALACYKKSINALENGQDSNNLSNRAYARQWIAECLLKQENYKLAFAFAISAEEILSKISPTRAKNLQAIKQKILSELPTDFSGMSSIDANGRVVRWMSTSS